MNDKEIIKELKKIYEILGDIIIEVDNVKRKLK